MKGNQYRRLHPMDKFAKKFYCQRARRNQIRDDKLYLRKIVRRTGKKEIKEQQETEVLEVMTEMSKLQKWLDDNGIKYERIIEERPPLRRNQILIETDYKELSFICQWGSYGYYQGLIEMYDFQNEPIGFLTAEECIDKIKEELRLK